MTNTSWKSVDDGLAEVVVKERVYKELEKSSLSLMDYTAEVAKGNGDYGTYTGTLYHLTLEYGPVPCGSFSVNVRPGEVCPEATKCYVTLTEDAVPYQRVWGDNEGNESVKDLVAYRLPRQHTRVIKGR